ncbi:hypothetical protein HT102_08350 [Hoyosella sp. G463]|uniref:Diacylglycerol O-acyltransferase n=1 Tax=Lolliginicoccus lacisalsi TaxID=2742202 RepID=A0A927PL75_9ACTN|nr:hypothetical protein [Lolliginicoccus lacisalsi]MBD8506493.1 hypothetical protein [Lolliginicoccus lacisalsi]
MVIRLAPLDCAAYRVEAAAGRRVASQAVWKYDRPVDHDVLARFHRRLGQGPLARRIAPATIPAAGDRWVKEPGSEPIEHAPGPLPDHAVEDWIRDRSHAPVSGTGPTWRMAVADLESGGAVVSVLASHSIADGQAFTYALLAAASDAALPVPADDAATARTALADSRAALAAAPATILALAGLPRALASSKPAHRPRPRTTAAAPVAVDVIARLTTASGEFRFPGASLPVASHDWTTRATALGGTTNSLFMAIAADIATRLGRVADDGSVQLAIPVSQRTAGDHRANAITGVTIPLDPGHVRTGLGPVRALAKKRLSEAKGKPHPLEPLIPITTALPRPAVRALAGTILHGDYLSVGCSNVGVAPEQLLSIDGAPATHMMMTFVLQGYRPDQILRTGGRLNIGILEAAGLIRLRVYGFDPRVPLDDDGLRELSADVLRSWGLAVQPW